MTVLVGVRCTDGVVIGADTAVTYGPGAAPNTLEVPVGFKLSILCEKGVIVASTGEVGLGQRFCRVVEQKFVSLRDAQKMNPVDAVTQLSAKAIADFNQTRTPWDGKGWGLGALVGMPLAGEPRLVWLDPVHFRPELVGERDGDRFRTLPLVTMGGGQPLADPFLAHAHRVLFGDTHFPTVSQARLLVAWTLNHARSYSTGGVGGDLDIAVLESSKGGDWQATLWDQGEALQAVREIEHHIREFPKVLAQAAAGVVDIQAAIAPEP